MNIQDALEIIEDFDDLQLPSEEEIFAYTEALDFLIRETKQTRFMMELGGWYYEQRQFDLALKYYEMAAAGKDMQAYKCLGYIWYYGRTGKRDEEKAFRYFEKCMKAGDLQAAYKVADMYKNGYDVAQDYEKYCSIIEDLYPKVQNAVFAEEPLPEIFTRLAGIRAKQGKYREARNLYLQAKEALQGRIALNPFFGNLNIMKWLMEDLERLPAGEDIQKKEEMDLYSLFVLLKTPAKVRFQYEDQIYEVESVPEEGGCAVCFNGIWYRTVDEFFAKANLDGQLLTRLYQDLKEWEVEKDADHQS